MNIVWDGIAAEEDGAAALPLQQSRGYAAALRRLGGTTRRVQILRGSDPVGFARIVSRRFGPLRLSLLLRGPVWTADVTPDEKLEALRVLARSASPLVVMPEDGGGGWGFVPIVTPRHVALLDLSPDVERLRAGLRGKWRNRLVRAEAAGLRVHLGHPDPAPVARLLTLDAGQQKARGYRALPARFTHAWLAGDPGHALLVEARRGGEVIAAMLFLLHRPWATYHIGWAGPEGRRQNAHNLLLWQAVLRLKADGYRMLDLGDVNTEGAPGLARYKVGTGAEVVALGATGLVLPALTRPRS
ncbi:GNAT family N-acetyltransferase [Defluviimonas sp. SAOS-178_SWC]|uniref:GNAT family N-acetyltransferase n=1 Tax=Defluviimonas sp. SAOS-178_SWC TaxID=3121287 RepID=UPI0032221CED